MSVLLRHFRIHQNDEQDPVGEDLFEGALWIIFSFSIVLTVVRYIILKYLDDNQARIRSEWRLLDALTRDFQTANESVDQIKQRANQMWDSEFYLRGITQTLNEIETQWVRKEGKVTSDAQRCVEGYDKLVANRRGFFRRYVSVFQKSIPIVELFLGFRRINEEIRNPIDEQNHTSSIVAKLEESRIKVRKLQDRPIQEAKQSFVTEKFDSKSASVLVDVKDLIIRKPRVVGRRASLVRSTIMQLQLLQAFMEDLGGLILESEIEEVWLKEAKEIAKHAQNSIDIFLKEEENQIRWLSVLNDYFVLRRKFKKIIETVADDLLHLLKTKERYGFKFIKRDSSNRDSANTSSPVIDSKVDNQELISTQELVRMLRTDMPKVLKDEETTNAANIMRKACSKFLEYMASEAEYAQENEHIRHINEARKLLKRCIQAYKIKVMEESFSVVGLEEDKHKLVLELITNRDQSGSIISILGMEGIGKTTLVKEILNHSSIINHFPVRHFVSVPEETDEIKLLRSVGNQILSPISSTNNERSERDYWTEELRKVLNVDEPCLLVLNNLCSKEAWDILRPAMFSNESTSTITLITTRDKAVASHANSRSIHQLQLRTGEESWEFFTQMVRCDEAVEKLARKVVVRTGGLPLAILRLGYLLSGKRVTEEELSVVLERVTQGQNQLPWVEIRDAIKDDQLQPVLKSCLSHFELFPRDSEISARRLVALWVAQGLAKSDNGNGNRTQEQVAYGYLLELIDRNIIQIVKKKLNGNVFTCRFPGILRELWLASRASNSAAFSWSLCGSFDQKLAYRFDDEDACFSRRIHRLDRSNLLPEDSCPRSIMFFDTREGNQPGGDIRNFLSKMITTGRLVDLVVLDLEGVSKPQLPNSIGNLKKLTYLGLRWTCIENLPKSIGQLGNLQTLDLKETGVQKLPSSVSKLKKLRNLHLNQTCRIKFMPRPDNLHKLLGVFVDEKCGALINGLPKLKNLRKLRLTIQLTLQQQVDLARYIPELTNLQSLSLESINESSEPGELILESLSRLMELSRLSLTGKIGRPSIMFELPRTLTELTLSNSELSSGVLLMQMLGNQLPELKFLSFLVDSYSETEMDFSRGFPKLLVLKLFKLPNLERMVVGEGGMPKLRVLYVRDCKKLEVPTATWLTNLSSLQEVELGDMTEGHIIELRTTSQQLRRNLRIRSFTNQPQSTYPRIGRP